MSWRCLERLCRTVKLSWGLIGTLVLFVTHRLLWTYISLCLQISATLLAVVKHHLDGAHSVHLCCLLLLLVSAIAGLASFCSHFTCIVFSLVLLPFFSITPKFIYF